MARIQILELPTEHHGDDMVTPFVLVIDQASETTISALDPALDGLSPHDTVIQRLAAVSIAERIGARAVLVFEETIDIPANEVVLDAAGRPLFAQDVRAMDDGEVRAAINADMNKARERAGLSTLGQYLANERTDIARDMDRLAKWKNELTDALDMDRTRDWDDIRNAARGIRKQRDDQGAAIERVRNLHRPVEHRGQTICWECSGYDFPGQTTDRPPVIYDQCRTLQVLNGDQVEPSA